MEQYENNYERMTPDLPEEPSILEKARPALRKATAAVLALALVAGGCSLTYASVNRRWENYSKETSAVIDRLNRRIETLQAQNGSSEGSVARTADLTLSGNAMTPREVYANNEKSVVRVSATVQSVGYGGQTTQGTSTGSGFILTDDGYVVTNHHVVENATSVKVILSTKEEYTAKVVGHEASNDVAVLKIEATDLPAVKIGSSDNLYVGDFVTAIGYPLRTDSSTMTYGIVSGKNQEVTTDSNIINMIQTDAAINSGSSGGPLFNMRGEVVGITSAKMSGTSSSGVAIEGISYAIPIDDVMSIIGDLKDFGYVTGAYLGVTVQNTDASAAALYGLPTGAYVVTVEPGSCADKAGIQEKDIIIGLGDYDVSNINELTRALRHFKAGDTTTLTVIRAGERKKLDATLDEKPRDLNANSSTQQEEMPQNGNYEEWFNYFFGDGKFGN